MYGARPNVTSIPKELRMDFSRILNKPFLIKTIEWNTKSTGELTRISLPSATLDNYLVKVPFTSAAKYRTKLCIIAQVSGTAMHAGLVLASSLPADIPAVTNPNQILAAPHVFLNANESTSICLEVPFYSNTHLKETPVRIPTIDSSITNDYADVIFYVMQPLLAADSASTELTISIHAMFKEEEFYVPQNQFNWVAESNTEKSKMDECLSFTKTYSYVVAGFYSTLQIVKFLFYILIHIFSLFSLTSFEQKSTSFHAEGFIDTLKVIPTYIFDSIASGAHKITGDVIDAARGALQVYTGFHNPNSTAITSRVINSYRNFHNQVDQPSLIEKLDQHGQFDRITQEPIFETYVDEMDMQNILSKPVHLGSFEIKSSTKEGTLLMSHPITPYVEIKTAPDFYSPLRTFYECSRYWRGGLEIDFQSVMSNFQFCKILVVKVYGNNSESLTTVPSYTDVHNLITDTVEFSAGGQIETVELPYASIYDQTECAKSYTVNALSHGMMYVYLLQPSIVSGSSPDVINIHAYMRVQKDFQFYGYALDYIQNSVEARPPSTRSLANFEVNRTRKFQAESEVTIVSSEQTSLLNTEENTTDNHLRAVDFKPMINVRDYMRRIVPVCKIINENKDPKSDTFGLQVINLKYLLSGRYSGRASAQQNAIVSLRNLFYGFNGGLKIKIKITGAEDGCIKFMPPSKALDPNKKAFNSATPLRLGNSQGSTGILERERFDPDSKSFPRGLMNTEISTHTTSISKGVTLHECVIPNYNQNRFLGSSASYYNDDTVNSQDDLGDLIISCMPTNYGTFVKPEYEQFTIEVSLGFTDETRFGFQVYSCKKTIPRYASTTRRDSLYSTLSNAPPLLLPTEAPKAYFFLN